MVLKLITLYYDHRSNDSPGRNLVLRGKFKLVHGDKNASVDQELWDSILSPGLFVKMSMIFRRSGEQKKECPRCGSELNEEGRDGWAAW